ncbi:hypothetical protein [Rhodobacter sp. NSM]|uniref:hypothetical protein n=1 Tax=Rhodobacter sp. NSM TaxID=3457501 RepID=UPI003FD3DBA7
MTSFDPLRDLHPPRLPVSFASLGWAEVLAAFGFGLALALVLFGLLRPAMARTKGPRLEEEIRSLAALPAEDRVVGQLRLLRRHGGKLPAEVAGALYRPGTPPPDLAPLIRTAARRGRDA